MKKLVNKYSNSVATAILIAFCTVFAVLVSGFCFFIGHIDIPLGFLLGGVVTAGLSLLSALAEKKDAKNNGTTFSIIVIGLRLVIIMVFALLIAFMYYRWNMKYINIFSFVGMYTLSIACGVIVHLVSKK